MCCCDVWQAFGASDPGDEDAVGEADSDNGEGLKRSASERAARASVDPITTMCARRDSSVVCKHWLKGTCNKGNSCRFLHQSANDEAKSGKVNGKTRPAKVAKKSALDIERKKYQSARGQLDEQRAAAAKAATRVEAEREKVGLPPAAAPSPCHLGSRVCR